MNSEDRAKLIQETVQLWQTMVAHKKSAEEKILMLMRHPDATTEQIMEAHASYVSMHATHIRTRAELCRRLPSNRSILIYPWERKE